MILKTVKDIENAHKVARSLPPAEKVEVLREIAEAVEVLGDTFRTIRIQADVALLYIQDRLLGDDTIHVSAGASLLAYITDLARAYGLSNRELLVLKLTALPGEDPFFDDLLLAGMGVGQ